MFVLTELQNCCCFVRVHKLSLRAYRISPIEKNLPRKSQLWFSSLDLAIKELHESTEFLQDYTEVSSRIKHSSKQFHAHLLRFQILLAMVGKVRLLLHQLRLPFIYVDQHPGRGVELHNFWR